MSAALVIGVAFIVFGMSFGVLAVAAGASVVQACVMSLLIFTGASQLSVVSVISTGGSVAGALSGAVILAARNAVYGLAMAPTVGESRFIGRLVGAQLVIDETTALSTAEHDPRIRRVAFWVSGPILYAGWNLGTFLGAIVGSGINIRTFGLDAAAPVMFTAMVVPHLRTRAGRRAALFGAVTSVALAPFMPIGLPILVSSLGILFGVSPSEDIAASEPITDGAP